MQIKVLVFAALRDRLGFSERELVLDDGATIADAAAAVFAGRPPAALAYARNQTQALPDAQLADGDELAILPPVSGGMLQVGLQHEPIDAEALVRATSDPSCGAVLSFLGTARELAGERLVSLEYEAYEAMAGPFLREVADELHRKFEIAGVSIVHRLGPVALGEISVAIVVAAPHRAAGFDALRHAIERIKEAAPIWKKEQTETGSHWVRADELDPSS